MEISRAMADENQMEALVRVGVYELLRHREAKRFPGYNGREDTTVSAKMRSMIDVFGALVAEKWLFSKLHASDFIDSAFASIYDSEVSRSDNQITVDAVDGLLKLIG